MERRQCHGTSNDLSYATRMQEEEEKNVFEEVIAEHFPNLRGTLNSDIKVIQ